jgi:catechol 2,3-dioxygenase-like lactoylglutathione lyase family enzyme
VARKYGFTSWRALKAQVDERQAKKVASPIMRFLPVADLSRTVAFYRDVLGFEIREVDGGTEAVLGPARIRFGKDGFAPTNWGTPKPPGSAILFIQSGELEALHAAVRSRDGKPSGIERVNWIKMRMFEIRDPDGNVLWFGQSFHKDQDSPSRRDQQPQGLRMALPELPFDDVAAAVTYYREVLGFRINHQQQDLGVMDRDAITVLLIARTEQHKGIGSCEFYVSDADALYGELLAKGAHILGPPVSHPWGLREFRVIDPEGNRITFGQTFE